MSELNINDLPRELVTKVLQFLDVVNLKKATLVCKLWNILIENACRWSLKLDYWSLYNEQKMNFILKANRKFGAIQIRNDSLNNNEQFHRIFQRHGFYVFKLILFEYHMENETALAELLNLTPHLKHAEIVRTNFYGLSDVPLNQVLPDLQKLKTLKMWRSDPRIIECFRKSKLTTMEIVVDQRSDHDVLLVDFLLRQDMLTSLTANAESLSQSILVELGKLSAPIPFRLTQLKISYWKCDASSHDHLLTFVKSQAKSLTEMEMNFDISSSLLECVFAMPKLNTLTVSVSKIPRNNNCYERMKENCSVRTLQLEDDHFDFKRSIQYFGNFFKKLPNIRSLILPCYDFCWKANASVMTQNLSKLESLSIHNFIHDSIIYVRFSNLKALHIQNLSVKTNWNGFTKFHSRLTELTIARVMDMSYLTSDDIDLITTNVDLQIIRLGYGFVADEQFFEIIRNKCTDLKVLDLHRSCVSHGLSLNVGINELRLSDDLKFSNFFRQYNCEPIV